MGSEVLVFGRDSLVDDSAPTRGAVARKVFEHNPLVGAQRDVLLGGDHVGVGERGAEVRLDQVAGDGPASWMALTAWMWGLPSMISPVAVISVGRG